MFERKPTLISITKCPSSFPSAQLGINFVFCDHNWYLLGKITIGVVITHPVHSTRTWIENWSPSTGITLRNFWGPVLTFWQIDVNGPKASVDSPFAFRQKQIHTSGPFLENLETFRVYIGWHNSFRIFKTKASPGTKFNNYFNFPCLYNIWKDQLYRISGSLF